MVRVDISACWGGILGGGIGGDIGGILGGGDGGIWGDWGWRTGGGMC